MGHNAAPIINNTLTIANGAQNSSSINVRAGLLCALTFPASFTGATVKIQNSVDLMSVPDASATFIDVYDDSGNIYTITAIDSAFVALDTYYTAGLTRFRVVSASAETGAKSVGVHYKEAA